MHLQAQIPIFPEGNAIHVEVISPSYRLDSEIECI